MTRMTKRERKAYQKLISALNKADRAKPRKPWTQRAISPAIGGVTEKAAMSDDRGLAKITRDPAVEDSLNFTPPDGRRR